MTVHRASVLRRMRPLLTLKAQNSKNYISHTGIKMRSGRYAPPRQDADTGEGYQELRPRPITRGTACLTWVCAQAVLKAAIYG
jgi:hypothetical protein